MRLMPFDVLAQRDDVAERAPVLQVVQMLVPAVGGLAGMEQAGDRHAEARLGRLPGHERVALGDEGEAQRGVDFPDPVGAGVGDVAKAGLAGLDGAGRLAGMPQDRKGEGADHEDRDRERGGYRFQELPPRLVRLPDQCPELGAIGRHQRQDRIPARRVRIGARQSKTFERQRSPDRVQELLVQLFREDQHVLGAGRQLEGRPVFRSDRADADQQYLAICGSQKPARRLRLVFRKSPRAFHQRLETKSQNRERLQIHALGVHRAVDRPVLPIDHKARFITIVLEGVESDALIRPLQIYRHHEVLDRLVPPCEILRDPLEMRQIPIQGSRHALDRIVSSNLILLFGAE